MRPPVHAVLLPAIALLAAFVPAPAAAGALNDGDIVIPGVGSLWKLGAPTPWLTSSAFSGVFDAMEDAQGRVVFLGTPTGRNYNDAALFRADPATGVLERLWYLPYIAAAGDTLPDGIGAAGFYGVGQSLHLVKTYDLSIDDSVNGGIPQVGTETSYAFSIGASVGGQMKSVEVRWRPSLARAEDGLDVTGAGTGYGVSMTSAGNFVYYGSQGTIKRAGPQLDMRAHLDAGGLGTVDARLQVTPTNEIVFANEILDDTTIPNVTIQCGPVTDTDVPMNAGGGFNVLTLGTLGMLGGALYATTNSVASSTPYEFDLAARVPFLNPYICLYYDAVTMRGGTPWYAGDTMAVTPDRGESSDGGSVLANADGNILSVTPGGGIALLGRSADYSSRPFRWHAPAAPALARAGDPARALAAGDTSLVALVVRVDSLVHVMLTDPAGRRIGTTASDSVVNDFGPGGSVTALGASGWPKLITIVGPAAGVHRVDVTGAASGTYGVIAYLAETSTAGVKSAITGAIAAGGQDTRYLGVQPPLTLQWGSTPAGVGGSQAPPALGFDWIGPSPATNVVRFACRVPEPGEVRLEMFDLAGRRVATLADGARPAGPFTTTWAGRGDDARRLPAGVYLARLSMPGAAAVRRVVLAR